MFATLEGFLGANVGVIAYLPGGGGDGGSTSSLVWVATGHGESLL